MSVGFSPLKVEFAPTEKSQAWFSPLRVFLPRRARLLEDLVWTRPDGSTYVVLKGTLSDGPSIPVVFQPLLPSRLLTMESGFLHDDYCVKGLDLAWADSEFRVALKSQGVPAFYAYVMYLALRFAMPWRSKDQWSWCNFGRYVSKAWSLWRGR